MTEIRIGKYQLVEKIGQGGMAEIYLAKLKGAEGFEKELVIKKILPTYAANQEFLKMLVDEAKLAVRLTHANIVQVHELGQDGNDHYIAMEYVPGIDLRRLWDDMNAKEKRIPQEISLFIMIQVLEGLAYAHDKKGTGGSLGIIHRDISPQNILISYDGAVKLTDFGIAKAAERTTETVSGVHKGKFSYMSPEQANLQEVTQSSDLFSVGIVLFELVTGRRLFGGSSDIETLDRIRRTEIRFSPEEGKNIPPAFQKIILKSLSRDPGDRFSTAGDFREALVKLAARSEKQIRREDLAAFLETVYSEETRTQRNPLPPEKKPTLSIPIVVPHGKKRRYSAKWFVAASLLLGVVFSAYFVQQKPPPAKALTEKKGGPLDVLVLPWGYVSFDGGARQESPLREMTVREGAHEITAILGPTGESIATTVLAKENEPIRCVARMEEGSPKIDCE